jgi:hypothetical protein
LKSFAPLTWATRKKNAATMHSTANTPIGDEIRTPELSMQHASGRVVEAEYKSSVEAPRAASNQVNNTCD